MTPRRFSTTVTDKYWLTDELLGIKLELSGGEALEFEPGQFVSVAVEEFRRRSYSMANSPLNPTYIETFVDTSPGGPGSVFFAGVQSGAVVEVLGPLGQFNYRPGDNPAYFFATGTGMVPFLSMLEHELMHFESGRELKLFYGVRTPDQVIAASRLSEWAHNFPNFTYEVFLSQAPEGWEGKSGRITQAIAAQEFIHAEAYICGGRDMIEDVEMRLLQAGVPVENIYYERFY